MPTPLKLSRNSQLVRQDIKVDQLCFSLFYLIEVASQMMDPQQKRSQYF